MDATETGFDCLSCIRKKSFLFMFDLIEGVKFLEIKILKNLFNNFRLLDFWELKFYLMKRFVDKKSRIWFRYLHRIKLHLLRFDWIFLSAYTEWISADRINFFEFKEARMWLRWLKFPLVYCRSQQLQKIALNLRIFSEMFVFSSNLSSLRDHRL